jgi:hypothetical protein
MASDSENAWLQTAANDLNNLLQVISESSSVLEPMCESSPEGMRYFAFLRTSLDRASALSVVI